MAKKEKIQDGAQSGAAPGAKTKAKRGAVIASAAALAVIVAYFTCMFIYKGKFLSKHGGSQVDTGGATVAERFAAPEGFERAELPAGSTSAGFRNFPLKNFGLAVYGYDGIRDFDADLGGVLDRDKEDIDQIFPAIPAGLTETDRGSVLPGDLALLSVNGTDRWFAVMDVCRSGDGRTLALLSELREGYEKFVLKGGAFGGYWTDLSAAENGAEGGFPGGELRLFSAAERSGD